MDPRVMLLECHIQTIRHDKKHHVHQYLNDCMSVVSLAKLGKAKGSPLLFLPEIYSWFVPRDITLSTQHAISAISCHYLFSNIATLRY